MRPLTGLLVVLAAACGQPSDLLFTRLTRPPMEVAPGLYRVTWSEGADVVRGFTADGARIVYQGRDVPGLGQGSYVLSVGVAEGDVAAEAASYQRALIDTIAQVTFLPNARLLVTWRAPASGVVSCFGCPPPPPVVDLALRRVPASGIVPLANLTPRVIPLPNRFTSDALCANGSTSLNLSHRIRIRPAEREILAHGVNPFGPVEASDASAGFYSDGETVWRYDPTDPTDLPDSLGPGAFPALAPDGFTLAAGVPVGVDSVSGVCFAGLCPCQQQTVQIDATGWEIVLHDVNGGGSTTLGPGLEPVFDPLASRIAVRRVDALYWVELATGEATEIPGTAGGYAPSISPDGTVLAFTADTFGNGDVFFVSIR